jgi:hypothetical protein
MYTLINQHIEQLLDAINPVRDIQPYVWLIQHFDNVNVGQDEKFQQVYRRFWQLNPARLSAKFHQEYFGLLEELKGSDNIGVEEVARHLLRLPTRSNGGHSLQFSFASKLVHMHRHDMPPYDSLLEDFFFLPRSASKSMEAKLNRKLKGYQFIRREYNRILKHGILGEAIENFRQRFGLGA